MTRTRRAGLLLHPTSLPGRFGIGDLGPETDAFLDWAAEAGQTLWQVLPLGPTGYGNSPYGTLSAFAGNPLLISPDRLIADGLLPLEALVEIPGLPADNVDFERVGPFKETLLRASFEHLKAEASADMKGAFEAFVVGREQAVWLEDWALFAALKRKYSGASWTAWPEEVRLRRPLSLEAARTELAAEIRYQRYAQFLFFRQWDRVRREAAARGIRIFGDIPIYVSADSADVWARQELFHLDEKGLPTLVAGVPPDYFSKTGQRWGNPLYRWDRLEEDGFSWWVERVRANLARTDLARIDHFRGLAAYWEVPATAETAETGRWVPGPGMKLFRAIERALGPVQLVAEDLGVITEDVRELLRESGFPGMRILQFAFSGDDEEYQPHNHVANCLVYTGTHDNDTSRGWWEKTDGESRGRLYRYAGGEGREAWWDLIRLAYTSIADTAVVPLQDVFGLGSEGRMNTPGEGVGNWSWRARKEGFTKERSSRLAALARLTGRFARRAREA